MTVLQIPLTDELKEGLERCTSAIGVSKSAYVKMLIAQNVLGEQAEDFSPGNLFNADRDNNGKGIPLDEFRKMLELDQQ